MNGICPTVPIQVGYWKMTPNSGTTNLVFSAYNFGRVEGYDECRYPNVIRPTAYLNSSVSICGGNGQEVSPYIAC